MLFRRLSIFVNGFTLEGAVAVGSAEDPDEIDVLDVLASLVDKSLVLAEPEGESLRYRLLGSTRMYALEKLSDAGEGELLARRHLHYLRDRFAELRAYQERTARKTELIEALATELEDVRAALDGALTRPDVLAGARLLADIGTAWEPFGLSSEGIARNEAFLSALPDREALLLAKLSSTLADMLDRTGRKERALEVATRAVAHARTSGDDPTLADALDKYAWVNLSLGRRDDAEKALAEAEAIPGASAFLRTLLLRTEAFLHFQKSEMDASARIWERLRTEHRLLGNTRDETVSFLNNAEIEHGRGQTRRAIALVNEILPSVRNGPEKQLVGNLLANLTAYLVAVDDLPGALEVAREVIELYATRESEDNQLANTIEHLALVCALRGDLARAAAMEGYVGAAFRQIGFDRESTERTTFDRLTALLREGLAPDELARLTAEGAALKPEAAAALALEQTIATKPSPPEGSS